MNWLKKLFSKKKIKCVHSYVKFSGGSSYRYICQYCKHKVSLGYAYQCEEFEFKQILLGSPIQNYSEFKYEYKKQNGEETKCQHSQR